jgi:hypothetical protein
MKHFDSIVPIAKFNPSPLLPQYELVQIVNAVASSVFSFELRHHSQLSREIGTSILEFVDPRFNPEFLRLEFSLLDRDLSFHLLSLFGLLEFLLCTFALLLGFEFGRKGIYPYVFNLESAVNGSPLS